MLAKRPHRMELGGMPWVKSSLLSSSSPSASSRATWTARSARKADNQPQLTAGTPPGRGRCLLVRFWLPSTRHKRQGRARARETRELDNRIAHGWRRIGAVMAEEHEEGKCASHTCPFAQTPRQLENELKKAVGYGMRDFEPTSLPTRGTSEDETSRP